MVRQHLVWLGLPSMRQVVTVQWGAMTSPTITSNPCHSKYQLDGTYNQWLLLPVFISSSNLWMKLECPLQMTGLGRVYGSSGLPNSQESPLGSFWCGPMERIDQVLIGIREAAGVAGSILVDTIHLRGSTPDFLLGFTPLAFSSPKPTGSRVFLSGLLP